MAIAVIVNESAAGAPALAVSAHTRLVGYIGKRAIAIVVVESVLAEVSDEQVFVAVVVVIANAHALSPARVRQTRFGGDISECAVAVVFEEMAMRLAAPRKSFQSPAVDHKDVQPTVAVVIVKRDSAAGGLQQILILVLAPKNSFRVQSRLLADVHKT